MKYDDRLTTTLRMVIIQLTMSVSFLINYSYTMKLFVCMLLVTMVVTAMLIDDSAGHRRRSSRRRRWVDGQAAVMEVVEEARELLDDLADLQEDAKAEQMMELEDLGQEKDDCKNFFFHPVMSTSHFQTGAVTKNRNYCIRKIRLFSSSLV